MNQHNWKMSMEYEENPFGDVKIGKRMPDFLPPPEELKRARTMLHIQRKKDESIVIALPTGATLRINVIKTHHTYTKLGIDTFSGFNVFRGELWDKLQKEKADRLENGWLEYTRQAIPHDAKVMVISNWKLVSEIPQQAMEIDWSEVSEYKIIGDADEV